MQCLHFSNPEVLNCRDKLFKIRELNDRFRLNLKQNFYPFQNICIDESLLLFKGRLSFKQFIPSKRSRFGIKSFIACDCKTGYIFDMLVYSGSETEISVFQENLGKSGNIVMTLMKDYLGKGHSLYVDNWYTSPLLFNTLHLKQTNSCGTVRKNRKYVPIISNKLQKGEISFRSTETLLCMKWQDKREVWMLTSLHHADIVETRKLHYLTKTPITKPTCIQDYNHNMGAVDKTDMVKS
ncbi:piggyBac transposable element-derived protein 4-like [Polistes fuscatus]|nr:piggyBac transposable element-derived protein 4-like [Polistes fuscatus]